MSRNVNRILKVSVKGDSLLVNPRLNKGSAFTPDERNNLDLTGRLPYRVDTLDQQCRRAYDQVHAGISREGTVPIFMLC
jgi:malate dehydrogenase (oxaloacetate-decarboxylating)